MEYCGFPTLRSQVNEKEINEMQTLTIMKSLLIAVNYLHSNGICHRDLKPSNVLLSDDLNTLKIIDFNVAKNFKKKSGKFSIMSAMLLDSNSSNDFDFQSMLTPTGKPFYRAPEISKGLFTEKVDIWSSGLIFLEIVTKRKCKKFKQDDVVRMEIRDLLSSFLEEDYNKRFSAEQAIQSIDDLMSSILKEE